MMKRIMNPACALLTAVLLVGGLTACDTDDLLEVDDADNILPEDVLESSNAADLLWAGGIGEFAQSYSSGGGGIIMYSGLFSDEFHLSGTFPTREEIDRRSVNERNGTWNGQYNQYQDARHLLERAAEFLAEADASDPRIAEMFALAGYMYTFFGENFCSGVPYSRGPLTLGEDFQFGEPTTTTETFGIAIDRFDSALGSTGGEQDLEFLALLGKARVLVNMGQYDAAADLVGDIPTEWEYEVKSVDGGQFNQRNAVWELNAEQRRWSVSDAEGGGIPFRSEFDPRSPFAHASEVGVSPAVGFDRGTPLWIQLKHLGRESDTDLATGVEARLIEAEAALHSNPGEVVGILNDLRAQTATILEADYDNQALDMIGDLSLPELDDPGTFDGRRDMLFNERARWLYATGHRLGDLRRLVNQYDQAADDVFPSGQYFKGGQYGDEISFKIPFQERENPNFSGGCLGGLTG